MKLTPPPRNLPARQRSYTSRSILLTGRTTFNDGLAHNSPGELEVVEVLRVEPAVGVWLESNSVSTGGKQGVAGVEERPHQQRQPLPSVMTERGNKSSGILRICEGSKER